MWYRGDRKKGVMKGLTEIEQTRSRPNHQSLNWVGWFMLVVATWAVFHACGYRFAGGGSLPAGVQRIFITIFENRTNETGIEKTFTDDLLNEFILKRKTDLAMSSEDADAVLSGVIRWLTVETISHTGTVTSDERRVKMAVHLKLRNRNKRIVWSGVVTEERTFVVADSNAGTEKNQRDAVIVLSRLLAEKAYNRLTTDF